MNIKREEEEKDTFDSNVKLKVIEKVSKEDDTITLDDFYNDLEETIEKKGIEVDKNNSDEYVLFDDAEDI